VLYGNFNMFAGFMEAVPSVIYLKMRMLLVKIPLDLIEII
jgi:hypothetical protein